MIELSWRHAQPMEESFDERYLQSVREATDILRANGREVTLGLGLHDAPSWVFDIPSSRFVDESGDVSAEPNLVFNGELRNAAERYLNEVFLNLDPTTIDMVRITSGGNAEVVYPGGGGYWAFDLNAQNGENLPASMPENPAPGWRPGDGGLDEEQKRRWIEWYTGALADVVNWQVTLLSRFGFRGTYQVLTPGSGVRPASYEEAIAEEFPAGLLGRGVAWHVFYRQIPYRPDLMAYVSSVADGSGFDDTCQPADRSVRLDSRSAEEWSATRWVSRLADEYGLQKGGENPGWQPNHPLSAHYVDMSPRGMMAAAFRQVRSCGFVIFYWAHSNQLWDGTVPFSQYAERIARARGRGH
jgi:hypothetical protein